MHIRKRTVRLSAYMLSALMVVSCGSDSITLPGMHIDPTRQAAELPYDDERLDFLIVVPGGDFLAFQAGWTAAACQAIRDSLRVQAPSRCGPSWRAPAPWTRRWRSCTARWR